MEKIMHCPDCGSEYEVYNMPKKEETCENCGTKLLNGSRDNTTIDGQNEQQAIASYIIGAQKLLSQLKNWDIDSREAHRLERQAYSLWSEDASSIGISQVQAKKIWQEKIIEDILSDDPAFNNNF